MHANGLWESFCLLMFHTADIRSQTAGWQLFLLPMNRFGVLLGWFWTCVRPHEQAAKKNWRNVARALTLYFRNNSEMHYFVHMYYRETGTETKFKVRMQVVGLFFLCGLMKVTVTLGLLPSQTHTVAATRSLTNNRGQWNLLIGSKGPDCRRGNWAETVSFCCCHTQKMGWLQSQLGLARWLPLLCSSCGAFDIMDENLCLSAAMAESMWHAISPGMNANCVFIELYFSRAPLKSNPR